MEPNRQYTFAKLFPTFFAQSFTRPKPSLPSILPPQEQEMFEFLALDNHLVAPFKGGSVQIDFGPHMFSLDDLTQDREGYPIYFPLKTLDEVPHNFYQYSEFDPDGRPYFPTLLNDEELTTHEVSVSTGAFKGFELHIVDADSADISDQRTYRYQLLLQSEKGTYIADTPAIWTEDVVRPRIYFHLFRPINEPEAPYGVLYFYKDYHSWRDLKLELREK
tara:strand:+ start:3480 stop:4136 length:657 start_codon:yes stop_codon:yes gene_type:complete